MSLDRSWLSEVKRELEDSLETLHRLEDRLPKPLTITESIGESETTLAVYDQLAETEENDG